MSKKKRIKINLKALRAASRKFALINGYIERGEEIPAELTRNFVTFPLIEDPFSELE